MVDALSTAHTRKIQTDGHLFLHDDVAWPIDARLILPSGKSYLPGNIGTFLNDGNKAEWPWLDTQWGWKAIESVQPGSLKAYVASGDQYYISNKDAPAFIGAASNMAYAALFLEIAVPWVYAEHIPDFEAVPLVTVWNESRQDQEYLWTELCKINAKETKFAHPLKFTTKESLTLRLTTKCLHVE